MSHKERVTVEKTQLDENITKLNAFFSNPIFFTLSLAEQSRLKRQYEAMVAYSNILGERITADFV